jgi:hypothetical protein
MEHRCCAACERPAEHTAVWWFRYGSDPQCLCAGCYLLGCVFNPDGTVRDPRQKRRDRVKNESPGFTSDILSAGTGEAV